MEFKPQSVLGFLLQRAASLVIALTLTLGVFLVLPLMQAIGAPSPRDLMVRPVDVANLPPPPPAPPEHEEEKEEPPEPPPALDDELPPLDLAQLELALNPVMGDELVGDFAVNLASQLGGDGGEEIDSIFSLADLDQRPRALFQPAPVYPQELRRAGRRGTVYLVFLVDARGRVSNPKVQKSTDPAFEQAALEGVKRWKFEPGTRKGKPVQFKMRVPITFNAG